MTIGFVVFFCRSPTCRQSASTTTPHTGPLVAVFWVTFGDDSYQEHWRRRAPLKCPVHIRMSRLKRNTSRGRRWRFEERGGAVLLRCVSLAPGVGSVDSGDGMCILLDAGCVGMRSNRWPKTSRSHRRRPRRTVIFGVFLPTYTTPRTY